MKVCMFHLMPYRERPADFKERFNSAYLDPVWFDIAERHVEKRARCALIKHWGLHLLTAKLTCP